MKIRRDIASLPARTSKETWGAIVKLITGADSIERHSSKPLPVFCARRLLTNTPRPRRSS